MFTYFLAEIDYEAQVLRISRSNGTVVLEVASVAVPSLAVDHWYRLIASVRPSLPNGHTQIDVELVSVTVPTVQATLSTITTLYVPSVGRLGLHANRAIAYFSYVQISALEP